MAASCAHLSGSHSWRVSAAVSFLTARLRPMLCLLPVASNARLTGPRLSQDLRSALPGLCGLRAAWTALKSCGWINEKTRLFSGFISVCERSKQMPSYRNWLAGLRHPAGFSLLKEITYDKLSKVVLPDSFYYPFLPQQKPLPRSHFPHPLSKVSNLSNYVI